MNGGTDSAELIPQDEARYQVETYLKQRYHEFEKVKFDSVELIGTGDQTIYRFRGIVFLRSRSTLERFVMEKSAGRYQFVFDINATNSQIINYVFT